MGFNNNLFTFSSKMKFNFYKRVFFFLLQLFVAYIGLAWYVRVKTAHFDNDYLAGVNIKEKLLTQVSSHRLILVGGSNMAFGINSGELYQAFGRPTINLSIHAGLGLNYMLSQIESSLKEGDIIILSPEYFLGLDGDYRLMLETEKYFFNAKKYFDHSMLKMISAHLNETRDKLKNLIFDPKSHDVNYWFDVNEIYNRNSFNEYGDVVSHLGKRKPIITNEEGLLQYHKWEGIQRINLFYAKCMQKGCKAFFVFPCLPLSEYNLNRKAIRLYEKDIYTELKMPVLGTVNDFLFQDSLFYDSIYHLDSNGREQRTLRLVKLMQVGCNFN